MTHLATQRATRSLRLPSPTAVCMAVLVLFTAHPSLSLAAQLGLAQIPAGNGGREPAPNIILSVDDSGSMGWSDSPTMAGLKAALNNAFSTSAVGDDTIRLGFQAMWRCRGFGDNQFKNYGDTCPENRVRPFSGTHRQGFNTWVNSLGPKDNTPSHLMIKNAGEFMKTTGIWNPYAKNPGIQETPLLACRKSFQIFMTDGEWNYPKANGNDPTTARNADGTPRTLPDGTGYDPYNTDAFPNTDTIPQTHIYADTYGGAITGYQQTITGYEQKIVSYEQKITGYKQIRTGYEQKIKSYEQKIIGYKNNGRPIYGDDLDRPIYVDDKSKPIYADDIYNPIYGNDLTKPIYGDDTSKPIYGQNVPIYGVSTLSDFVFDYWATDLQPGIANEVRPMIKAPGSINFGTAASPYWLEEYWNPKNNPATWQSLTTYTIGFGNGAALSKTTAPKWGGTTGTTWSGGDYDKLIMGQVGWGDVGADTNDNTNGTTYDVARRQELWHMAINGRGRYVSANNSAELATAFSEIVNQIIQDASTPIASIAANTQTITSGTRVYLAGYNSTKWKGTLEARPLTSSNTLSSTVDWEAGARLDLKTPANRVILTSSSTAGYDASGTATPGGAPFVWSSLSNDQKSALKQGDSDTIAQERIDYLRGDRSKEVESGGAYRNRGNRLGDIVNSNIWVTTKPNLGYTFDSYATFRAAQASRPGMVYVGANDGMLHGFDVTTGDERLAYVPKGVYNKLAGLTQPSYDHTYTVDGHPFTGDFRTGSSWATALVSGLAGGGKGYFVLDVTAPGNFAATTAAAASTVLVDTTDGVDADIGHIYSEPVTDASNSERVVNIAKLNNGRWAAILGNGVNSSSEKAVLLIQYLDGDRSLKKIELDGTGANGNGLSNPQVIDIDGNGTADVAYAGDMRGNLWKIDLSSATASNWRSYFPLSSGTAVPMFVAQDTANTRQPITTAPQWATHPDGGLMLAFGTGREITQADRTTNSVQTLYAVRDNTTFAPSATPMMSGGTTISGGRADLVLQTLTSTMTINQQQFGKTSANVVNYSGGSAKRGFYLEFPALGERAVYNGGKLSDRLIYIRSRIPAVGTQNSSNEETCEPNATAAEEYFTVLDIVTGAPSTKKVFDTDGGGFTGTEEAGVSRWKYGKEDRLLMRTGKPGEFASISPQAPNNSNTNDPTRQAMGFNTNLRLVNVGWRQLQ